MRMDAWLDAGPSIKSRLSRLRIGIVACNEPKSTGIEMTGQHCRRSWKSLIPLLLCVVLGCANQQHRVNPTAPFANQTSPTAPQPTSGTPKATHHQQAVSEPALGNQTQTTNSTKSDSAPDNGNVSDTEKLADREYMKASRFVVTQDWSAALTCFDEAIRLNPSHVLAHMGRGIACYELREYDLSIAALTTALRLKPTDKFVLFTIYTHRGAAYGDTSGDTRNHDLALKDYTEAIRLAPQIARPADEKVVCRSVSYANRGNLHGRHGDHAQAIKDYTEAIKLTPWVVQHYYCRSFSLNETGAFLLGLRDLRTAERLEADAPRRQGGGAKVNIDTKTIPENYR